ncbi:MAG: sugar kinase [Chloroflexi bacterium]|nr:sugar kinase [Chloroflexota bacterium]
MEKTLDVVAVGTLNVDLIIIGEAPRDIEALTQWVSPATVELTAAGSVGYCVVDLARLGLRVSLLSSVADDIFGEWILRQLQAEGVGTQAITVEKDARSGIGIYMLLFGSRKRPLTGRLATHAPWPAELSPMQEEHLRTARLLHCGGYLHYPQRWGEPTEKLYRKAKEYGLITSVDTQFPLVPVDGTWMHLLEGLLPYVDIVFCDESEAQAITGISSLEEAAGRIGVAGPGLVVIKKGAEGALLVTKEQVVHQPAFPMEEVTDSIGAGDAFDAGVLYSVLAGWDIQRTARFAAATAALTLKGVGGTQTAPTLAEVEAFLAARGH